MPVSGWLMGTAFDCFFAMHQQKRQPECGERCSRLAGSAGLLHGVDVEARPKEARQADVHQ